jgi:hypothetical protein
MRVMNSAGRVLSRVIKNLIQNMISAKIPVEQVGFTAGKSCLDNIMCLQQIITIQ